MVKTNNEFVYHIIFENEWLKIKDNNFYHPISLDSEGFIHFSYEHQVPGVVTRYYSGRDDLLLLKIDVAVLDAELKIEKVENLEAFPHLYGELNLGAVVGIFPLIGDSSKTYSWQEK
jgi:uncharacterized protein (DUF952 family)